MRLTIINRLYRQLGFLVIACAILVSAYVISGRLLMPMVSRYASYFEGRMVEYTGIPVNINSLSGSFNGLNPKLRIDGLRLLIGDNFEDQSASALVFDSATIIVDIPRSIWERRWILEDFAVETLEINVEQSLDGDWNLAGFDGGNDSQLNFNDLFQSLQRISLLNLRNVGITFFSNEGNSYSFNNGVATILNEDESHFLHVNASFEQSAQQIALSFEVVGNEASEIDGKIHLELPVADYSTFFAEQLELTFEIDELVGGGSFWIDIKDGQFSRGVTEFELEKLGLAGQEMDSMMFSDISGASSLNFNAARNEWELSSSDMSLSWRGYDWRSFNLYSSYNSVGDISMRIDHIDLSLISQLATTSGFLDEELGDRLAQFGPKGVLENLDLFIPSEDSNPHSLRLVTNIKNGEFNSVGSSPSMKGLSGYFEGNFAIDAKILSGFLEVESEEFSINLPNLFTRFWDYSYINGRLSFQADISDGQKLELVSSVIVAESEAADGRVTFNLTDNRTIANERNAYLELLVGASRVDASFKTLYLPDGPNVKENTRSTMEYLDKAILGGSVENSGVIFRGNSLADSGVNEKTFQSYFVVTNGEVNFSDEWPRLGGLSGSVTTDDNNVEIDVREGQSIDLRIKNIVGDIQRNQAGENWLKLEGEIAGETSAGLDYLLDIPVGEDFKNSISDWEAAGDFFANLNLDIPLNRPNFDTNARINAVFNENTLAIPEYSLTFDQLSGPIIYDTRRGLEKTELEGALFSQPASLSLSSDSDSGEIQSIFVSVEGMVDQQQLLDWPKQSGFVRSLLANMDGDLSYSANLSVDTSQESNSTFLTISSNLQGASLNLPMPFGKNSVSRLPLDIELEFGDHQLASGTFGEESSFIFDLTSPTNDGVIYLGDTDIDLAPLIESDAEGVAVLGNLDKVVVEEWITFIGSFIEQGNVNVDFGNALAFVDVAVDAMELYGQELPNINLRIEGDESSDSWTGTLMSEAVRGIVTVPRDSDEYLQVDLDYLRLPSDENDQNIGDNALQVVQLDNESEVALEKEDPLESLDPRKLPPLLFSTDEFSIGSRSYGSWRFTLNPNNEGASFTDLVFDFRGLRLGMDGPYVDGSEVDEYAARFSPNFMWSFDGVEHTSALRGIIYADDMADVLVANGYAASIESEDAIFFTDISWPGSPAFFGGSDLSGEIDMDIDNGRFRQGSGGQGALRLISILNFDAIMRRARLSDDLVRAGFAYDEIEAELTLDNGLVKIEDRLLISSPSSLYQITGELNLKEETILGEMYVTLPVSDNIPWLGLLTANLPLAFGAYLFDQIFGEQVDSLTSAVYVLDGPWEGLEPEFKQAFGSPADQ
ncbi:MAG: DUF3971 domain-containing protein [Gammaproteobacteria bacterium]|nr:DUF3971 domain-containing protein [Gammaproteobacteria bacterium]